MRATAFGEPNRLLAPPTSRMPVTPGESPLVDDWLVAARDALAAASGVPVSELDLDDATVATLLDLARIAAHESGQRTNAPLLCFLVGVAAARGEAGVVELAEAIRDRV
jgi:hypothetical protein